MFDEIAEEVSVTVERDVPGPTAEEMGTSRESVRAILEGLYRS
jgi:hypothetical protein